MRESGTERLEEALGHYESALSVCVPAGADYYVTLVRGNRDRVAALIAQRRGQSAQSDG